MASLASLVVDIQANTAQYRRGLSGVGRATLSLNGVVKRLGATIATVFAARKIFQFTRGSIEAFQEQEDAVVGLNAALLATGRFTQEASQAIQREASAIQQVTRVGDEALISATATLAQLSTQLRADDLIRAQRAIVGIADTFLRGDVENAAALLGKTIGSTTNALTRYGIQIDTSASETDKLNQILEQTGTFFSVSQARADTFAGKVTQLTNAWGDFREELASFLGESPMVKKVLDDTKSLITNMTRILASGGPQIREAFELLGNLAAESFTVAVISALDIVPGKMVGFLDRIRADAIENIQAILQAMAAIASSGVPRSSGAGRPPGAGPGPPPGLPGNIGTPGSPFILPGFDATAPSPLKQAPEFIERINQSLRDAIPPITTMQLRTVMATEAMGQFNTSLEETARKAALAKQRAEQLGVALVSSISAAIQMIMGGGGAGGIFGGLVGILGGAVSLSNPLLGAGLGGLGAIISTASARRRDPVPVSLERFSAEALDQQRRTGPDTVRFVVVTATGETLADIQKRGNDVSMLSGKDIQEGVSVSG